MSVILRARCYHLGSYSDDTGTVIAHDMDLVAVKGDPDNMAAFAPNPVNFSVTLRRSPLKIDAGAVLEIELRGLT